MIQEHISENQPIIVHMGPMYNQNAQNTNLGGGGTTITNQATLIFENLMRFYKERHHLDKMVDIVNGNSILSLRIIDWFVTNYSKKYYVIYEINNHIKQIARFNVYNEYKLQLKAYGKIKFDPFCRWTRIMVPLNDEKYIETTIGQLNFFKWAIENDILAYIEEHYDSIDSDMNSRNTTSRKKKKNVIETSVVETSDNGEGNISTAVPTVLSLPPVGSSSWKTRKRREELSTSACKCMKKENVNIVFHF